MSPRAWWAAVAPAVPVVAVPVLLAIGFALLVDGGEGPLAFAALVLLGSALLHGARPGPLPGTPTQNLGRVVLVAATVLGLLVLLGVAFVAWLFAGLCGSECDGRPVREHGALVALGFVAAFVVLVAGAAWLWSRIGRDRSSAATTPRGLTVLPAVAVGVVALVTLAAGGTGEQRLEPTGEVRVLWDPCDVANTRSGDEGCGAARSLRTAVSGRALLAIWRSGDALLGATTTADGTVVRLEVATGLPTADGPEDAVALAADRTGGFVAAWATPRGLRFARVAADGDVRLVASAPASGGAGARPGGATTGGATTGGTTTGRAAKGADAAGPPSTGGIGAQPETALVATARGFVAFLVDRGGTGRPGESTGTAPRRLRVLALDADLAARGRWRTIGTRVPSGLGQAVLTADGRAAVATGPGAVRSAATVDASGGDARVRTDRTVVPGPGGARVEALPGSRGVRSRRYRPELLDAVRDPDGALRSLWDTRAPRSDEVPARVRQQWLLGPGTGTPERPLADGLVEAQLAVSGPDVLVVGLRPTGPGRGADAEVVVVRED